MATTAANRPKRAPYQRKGPMRQLISRITGRPLDIFEGRTIRKDENGKELLDDYFPEPVNKGDESDISRLSNFSQESSMDSPEEPIERPKRLPFLLGGRTGKILFPPGKVFRKNPSGKEDIKDYFPSEESKSDFDSSDASDDADNSKLEKLAPGLEQDDSKTSSRSQTSRLSKARFSSVNIKSPLQNKQLHPSTRHSLVPATPKISNTAGRSTVSQVSPQNVIVHQPRAISPLPGINVNMNSLIDMPSKVRTRLSFVSPTNTQQDQTTPTKTQISPQKRVTPTKRSALHERTIPNPDPFLTFGNVNPICDYDDSDADDDDVADFFNNFRLIRPSLPPEASNSVNVVASAAERDPSSVVNPAKTSSPSEKVSVGTVAAAIRAASTPAFESRSAAISTSPRPKVHSSTRNDEHRRSLNITFGTSHGPNISAILQKQAKRSTRTLAEATILERTAIVSPNQGKKIYANEDTPSVNRTRSSSRNIVRSSRKTPAQVSGVRTTSTRKTRSSTATMSMDLTGGTEMRIEEGESTNVDQFSTPHVEVPKESRLDRFASSSSVHPDTNKNSLFSSAPLASIADPSELTNKPSRTVADPNNLSKLKKVLAPLDVTTSVWKPTRQPPADATSGPITRAITSSSRAVESTAKEKRSPTPVSKKKNKKLSSVSFSDSASRRMIITNFDSSSSDEDDKNEEQQKYQQQYDDKVEPVREMKSPVRLSRSSTSIRAHEQPSTSAPIDQASLLFDQMLASPVPAAKGTRSTPQPSVVMPPPLPTRTSKRGPESSAVIDTSDDSRRKSRRLTRLSKEPLLLDIHEDDGSESSTIWGRSILSGVNSKGNKRPSKASSGSSRILTDEDVQEKEEKKAKTKRHVSRVVIENEEEGVQKKAKTKRKMRRTTARIMSDDDENDDETWGNKRKRRTRKKKQPHKQDLSKTDEATSGTDSDLDRRFFSSEESYEEAKELWKTGIGKVKSVRASFVDSKSVDPDWKGRKKLWPTKGKSVREENTDPEEESADSDLSAQSSPRQPSKIPKRRVTHKRKMKYSTSADESEMTMHNSTTIDDTEMDDLSGPIERPRRQRIKRLEYWRGERILYRPNSEGGHSILGVDPGLDPARSEFSLIANRKYKKREPKRDPANEEEPEVHIDPAALAEDGFKMGPDGGVYVINPLTGKETFVACFQAKDSHYAFTVSGKMASPEDGIIFTKPIRQLTFSAGTIELKPKVEKGLHHLKNDTMGFFVLQGILEVTIHDTRIIAKKGDMFFVPQGNKYNLRNGSDFVVKLHYFQLKNE